MSVMVCPQDIWYRFTPVYTRMWVWAVICWENQASMLNMLCGKELCEWAAGCSLRSICSHSLCFLRFSRLPFAGGANCEKRCRNYNSRWFYKWGWFIRGTMKECSFPPVGERCLLGIEQCKRQRGGKYLKMNMKMRTTWIWIKKKTTK